MPSEKSGRSRRPDPPLTLLESALHDGAVILDAYGRFAATLIGVALFPYAMLPPKTAPGESQSQKRSRSRHHGFVQVALALLLGAALGRRLSLRRAHRRSDSPL